MDDLISRAAAIEYLMTNMGWHDEDGYDVDDADEKRAIITDLVNGIPTIDAIPVGWLREKANGNDFVIGRAARFILRTWEQETQKLGIEPK